MDPTLQSVLTGLGFGQYVAVIAAIIGLFSAISTIYPATWPGAKAVHWLALLKGNAAPAIPAGVPSAKP